MPLKTKKLIRIVLIISLALSVPLFVWGILTQNFDIRRRAVSGGPVTGERPPECIPVNFVVNIVPEDQVGCHNIQEAIHAIPNAADTTYVINIAPGVYTIPETGNEFSLIIEYKHNLRIEGMTEDVRDTRLVFHGNRGGLLIKDSAQITLGSFTIDADTTNGAIYLKDNSDITIGRMIVNDLGANVIYTERSHGVSIGGSQINAAMGGGITMTNSQRGAVSTNKITGTGNGISIYGSWVDITNNLIYANRENGIYVSDPWDFLIGRNTIISNSTNTAHSAGIKVGNIATNHTRGLDIKNNVIVGNRLGVDIDNPLLLESFNFENNDVWNNLTNYRGFEDMTGVNGNISEDPLYGPDYCVEVSSPTFYGEYSLGEYMGYRAEYCAVLSPTATPTPIVLTPMPTEIERILGDVNGDGVVNIVDIAEIVNVYGTSPPANIFADLNNDGIVNIVDIGIVIDNYGAGM